MAYTDHFKHADDVINELNKYVPSITDQLIKSKYVGFVSVAAVTVYELAIKDIFIEFANKKHKVLGSFTEAFFDRINGRIKIKIIKDDYISKFGNKYVRNFSKKIDEEKENFLRVNRRDFNTSYSNVITWRNDFAHEGKINQNATYEEVVLAYEDGKQVIHCLANSMVR